MPSDNPYRIYLEIYSTQRFLEREDDIELRQRRIEARRRAEKVIREIDEERRNDAERE